MGSGLRVSLLSYVSSLAEPELRGRLYGAVQVVETIGQLIALPMSEQATVDLSKDNSWLEWPFIVMSVCSSCYFAMHLLQLTLLQVTGVCVLAIAMVSRVSFS